MNKDQLNARIEGLDKWGTISVFILIFGLTLEFAIPLIPSHFVQWLPKVTPTVLVVGGIVGEWFSHWRQKFAAKMLSGLQEQEISQLQLKVAETNLAMENLRKSNLELLQKIQPRTIQPEKRTGLQNSLLAIAPKGNVFVQHDWMDVEA